MEGEGRNSLSGDILNEVDQMGETEGVTPDPVMRESKDHEAKSTHLRESSEPEKK